MDRIGRRMLFLPTTHLQSQSSHRGSDDDGLESGPDVQVKPPAKPSLSLFDAICAYCDPELVPEFRDLMKEGLDDAMNRYIDAVCGDRHKVGRYEQLLERLTAGLRDR